MRFVGDERAQSIQVGAVLLFAILIVFFAVWQAIVIPNQNEQVEFDHNQEVQSQLEQLRADMAALADSSTVRSSAIELGVRYPARLVSLNPPAASGRLETVGTTNESIAAVIENATAAGETGDFWNGSERSFNTGAIAYEPRYSEYAQPPRTVLENGVVFNEFSSGRTIPLTDQVVVDGDRIRIGALNGSLSLDRIDSASVDLQPVSTQTRTVAVGEPVPSTPGGNVTIELPTRLDQADWEELVAGEQVHDVTVSGGTVTIEMENLFEGESYDLQLWKVGVGTGATPTETEYLTNVGETDRTVQQGQNVSLVVEARDRFNDPKSGVRVNATATDGTITPTATTDGDGRAVFEYDSSEVTGSVIVTLSLADRSGDQAEVTIDVTVTAAGQGNGTAPEYQVSWDIDEFGGVGTSDGFRNLGNGQVEIEKGSSADMAINMTPFDVAGAASFSVSDSRVGTLNPYRASFGRGANDRRTITQFQANTTGVTNATVFSGGSRDRVEVIVTPQGAPYRPDTVAQNRGRISNFNNMKVDDANSATMDGLRSNPFDINVTTESVPSGNYQLEIRLGAVNLQGGSSGIDITARLDDGTVIGSTTIDGGDEGSTVSITLDEIQNQQDIVVSYVAGRQNDELEVELQQIR